MIELKSDFFEAYGGLSLCHLKLGNKIIGLKYKLKWRELSAKRGYDISDLPPIAIGL